MMKLNLLLVLFLMVFSLTVQARGRGSPRNIRSQQDDAGTRAFTPRGERASQTRAPRTTQTRTPRRIPRSTPTTTQPRVPRTIPTPIPTPVPTPTTMSYSQIELDTMAEINNYRQQLGLVTLKLDPYISQKALEHDKNMIAANLPSHDGFAIRSKDIMVTLGAKTVGENVAFGFTSASGVFQGWFNSPGHRETMEGNYNLAGIAIKADPVTKRLYFTLILAKI